MKKYFFQNHPLLNHFLPSHPPNKTPFIPMRKFWTCQLFAACLLLFSCREKTEAPLVPCLLKNIQDVAGTFERDYQYDAANRLVRVSDSEDGQVIESWDLEYDSNGRWIKLTQEDGYSAFEYDPAGKVVSIQEYRLIGSTYRVLGSSTLEYNARHQVTKRTYFPVNTTAPGDYFRYEYNAAGNVTKEFYRRAGPNSPERLWQEFTAYDNKNSLYATPVLRLYTLLIRDASAYSLNNPLSINYYKDDGTLSGSDTFVFEYNSRNYPIHLRYSSTWLGQEPESETYRLAYNCGEVN